MPNIRAAQLRGARPMTPRTSHGIPRLQATFHDHVQRLACHFSSGARRAGAGAACHRPIERRLESRHFATPSDELGEAARAGYLEAIAQGPEPLERVNAEWLADPL